MPQRSLWCNFYGQIIQNQNKTWLCINHTYLVYCIPPPIAPNTNTYSRHSTGNTMLIIPTMSHGSIYSLLGQKIPIMHWKYTIEVSGAKANKVSASVRNINNWLETFFFKFIIIANTIFSKRDIWYLSRGPVSIREKTSYRKITWNREATSFVFVFKIVRSLWYLTSAWTVLPTCLSNFKAMW